MARFLRVHTGPDHLTARGGNMERNQRDRSQSDQGQRDKLQGGSKPNPEQDRTRRGSEPQKQGGSQQQQQQQGGSQGFERDVPRRSEESFDIDRQGGVPGRGSEKGIGQSGSPRQQPGVGEKGQTGSPGRRS